MSNSFIHIGHSMKNLIKKLFKLKIKPEVSAPPVKTNNLLNHYFQMCQQQLQNMVDQLHSNCIATTDP